MKLNKLLFLSIISLFIIMGCGKTRKESTFICYDLNGDGSEVDIVLTYEKDSDGNKTFYDGETLIGDRYDAVEYANEKSGGLTCMAGTDRKEDK